MQNCQKDGKGLSHLGFKSKVLKQSQYLTPCCELAVQNPTKTLMSDKGPCKTFDLNPKWEKLCRSLAIFHGICIAPQKSQNNKVDI
jgi:hypothetical protein